MRFAILLAAAAIAVAPVSAADFVAREVASLDNPWGMAFLPDGRALITEKPGRIRMLTLTGTVTAPLAGVPAVAYSGQLGLLDIEISPFFKSDRFVYISYAEAAPGGEQIAVARAKFTNDRFGPFTVIWRNQPTGGGHPGGRMAMTRKYELFVATGDRQQGSPAQDTQKSLGKIVRLNLAGAPKVGNPFAKNPAYRPEIWTLGHRNPYGLAFDPATDNLWEHEMGPQNGDELNLIVRGANYAWPLVSNGQNYDGSDIPDHAPGDGFEAPKKWWASTIAPSGMSFYTGDMFPQWKGHLLMGGLAAQSLFDITVSGSSVTGEVRYPVGARVRDVQAAPDGSVYLLTDGGSGKLLRLTPN